jgi:hypothetical protein
MRDARYNAQMRSSLPGLTRQSIPLKTLLRRLMDARVKPAHDAVSPEPQHASEIAA